ncbi:Crp/Fnr family transcriptional regulator [Chryseolinea sp. T2]|uniref:Crp/Fnr family transcriptional regulator n=1 Tax=Chryseolinea sp. T2 TaxID=3129255 RepID=UPI0030773D9E
MDELLNYLRQLEVFDPDAERILRSHVREAVIGSHDILYEQGQIPEAIAFVASGALSVGTYRADGSDVISYFIVPGDFVVDVNDFKERRAVRGIIQAVVDTRVVFFTKEGIGKLSASITWWDEMWRKVANQTLIDRVRKRAPSSKPDARSRYIAFNEQYPGLFDRIPRHVVASYLDINTATLSRVREK